MISNEKKVGEEVGRLGQQIMVSMVCWAFYLDRPEFLGKISEFSKTIKNYLKLSPS